MDNEGYLASGSGSNLDKIDDQQIQEDTKPEKPKRAAITKAESLISFRNFLKNPKLSNKRKAEDTETEENINGNPAETTPHATETTPETNSPTKQSKLKNYFTAITNSIRSQQATPPESQTSNDKDSNEETNVKPKSEGTDRKIPKLADVNAFIQKYVHRNDNETNQEITNNEDKKSWIQTLNRPLANLRIHPVDDNGEMIETSGMCGALGRYPTFLQRFATPRYFLTAFCLQNVLQGIAASLFIGTTPSIERHFHFSSQAIGSILMFSEVGPIFSSLVLSQLGGRGNRPRWMAFGQVLSMLGLFLAFANNFFYPPPQISEVSGEETKKLCRYRDLLTESVVPLTSRAASFRSLVPEKCFSYNQSAYFSWLLVHTLIGIGNSLVYTIGAPYLDDSIAKRHSPMYFAVSFAVRILGPLIGFSLTAGLLKIYVHPSVNPGIGSSDPRWIGAWWMGFLVLCFLFFFSAMFTSLFPRQMKKTSTTVDREKALKEEVQTDVDDKLQTMVSLQHDSVKANDQGKVEVPEANSHVNNEARKVSNCSAVIEHMKEVLVTTKRLLRNPIIAFSYLGDFFGMSGVFSFYMWLPKYYEHHFRVSKSASVLATGITGVSSLIIGVLGGGMFVQRYRPTARTITRIVIVCKLTYILALAGLMHVDCGFNEDLPGVLSPDQQRIELYRGCSGGCECSNKEFIPVCVTDGPLQVTFFSPCHAGCYLPENQDLQRRRIVPLTKEGQEIPVPRLDDNVKIYSNCSCGSTTADVRTGYCKNTCSGFMLFSVLYVTVNSFVAFGSIGGMLISLRCVAVEDKAASMGLKSAILSLVMLLNPVIFGSLFDSTCLLWEEACGETGACWVYDTIDSGKKMFVSAIILYLVSTIFECFVYRHVKDLKLFDEPDERNGNMTRTLSLALSNVFGSRFNRRNNEEGEATKSPSVLNKTFRRLSSSVVSKVFRSEGHAQNKEKDNSDENSENQNKLSVTTEESISPEQSFDIPPKTESPAEESSKNNSIPNEDISSSPSSTPNDEISEKSKISGSSKKTRPPTAKKPSANGVAAKGSNNSVTARRTPPPKKNTNTGV